MNNSDRLGLLLILAVIAMVFFVLFLIFHDGGKKSSEPLVIPFNSAEIPIDELEYTPRYTRTSAVSSANAISGSGSASSDIDDSMYEDEPHISAEISTGPGVGGLAGFDSRLAAYIRPAPAVDYDKKKARLREELRKGGCTNEEYIQMLVFSIEDRPISDAVNRAEQLANSGNIAAAIRVLKELLNEIHPGDLLGKQRIFNTLHILYMEGGYPDEATNNSRQVVALQKQITRLQLDSPEARDPRVRSHLEAQLAQIEQLDESGENLVVSATKYMADHLRQNQGFSPELKRTIQGTIINAVSQSVGQADMDVVRNDFTQLNERLEKNWARTQ